jgi:UDP-glucuronate 4-epimerase
MQAGDVPDTWADVEALVEDVGYRPSTPIEVGVRNFIDWYRNYYRVS